MGETEASEGISLPSVGTTAVRSLFIIDSEQSKIPYQVILTYSAVVSFVTFASLIYSPLYSTKSKAALRSYSSARLKAVRLRIKDRSVILGNRNWFSGNGIHFIYFLWFEIDILSNLVRQVYLPIYPNHKNDLPLRQTCYNI